MSRPRRQPYVFRRKDRPGLYAYLSRDEPHTALGTSDEEEAQSKLAALLYARRLRAVAPGDRPAAEVFAEHLRRSKTNHTPKTNYEHGLNGRRVQGFMAEREVASFRQVTKELVEDYKTARRFAQASPARINAELNSWKGAAKIAAEWELIPESALRHYVKLREPRPEPHRVGLTKRDLERFMKAEKTPGFRALWRVLIGTGMRDEEVRHMTLSDVRKAEIVVTPKAGWSTKGYRYRSIPASPATVRAAKAFLAARPSLNLDKKNVWVRLQRAAKAAQIGKHFSLHDLRRAWASHMLDAGYKVELISKWLGHADIVTTMRYLRIVTDEKVDPRRLPF